MKIRFAASTEDIQVLVELGACYHQEGVFSDLPYDREKVTRLGIDILNGIGCQCLIMADQGGVPVGYLMASVGEHFFSSAIAATIQSLYVRPENRGGMAAVKLLHGFKRWASQQKAERLYVNVASGIRMNESDRFFRRLGFSQTGGNYLMRI